MGESHRLLLRAADNFPTYFFHAKLFQDKTSMIIMYICMNVNALGDGQRRTEDESDDTCAMGRARQRKRRMSFVTDRISILKIQKYKRDTQTCIAGFLSLCCVPLVSYNSRRIRSHRFAQRSQFVVSRNVHARLIDRATGTTFAHVRARDHNN